MLYTGRAPEDGFYTMSIEALEPMKQAARKFSAFAQELPPLPTGDDGSIDEALLDLDQKLTDWTQSMLKADQALTKKLSKVHSTPITKVSSPEDREEVQRHLLEKAPAKPEPKVEAPSPASSTTWTIDDSPLVKKTAPQPTAATASVPPAASAKSEGGEQSWPSTSSFSAAPAWPEAKPQGQSGAAPRLAADIASSRPKSSRGGVGDSVREKLEATAAADEKALKALDADLVRRVRKLRRLDPYTKIEELIARAREVEDRETSDAGSKAKSSWWRRK